MNSHHFLGDINYLIFDGLLRNFHSFILYIAHHLDHPSESSGKSG